MGTCISTKSSYVRLHECRRITVFSTPYYSPQSLLPLDPPPYTLPTPKPSKSAWRTQPTVSLASYPLPDGTWRWVSRAWMIDMRGDGLVQHDGFEYAWSFRSGSWRPEIGALSTGAWVRRRRWVRLMVRVRKQGAQPDAERAERAGEARGEAEGEMPAVEVLRDVPGATRPPSVAVSLASEDEKAEAEVWLGDDGDWERCRAALKRIGRDGRKLELWKRWFGFGFHSDSDEGSVDEHEKGKSKTEEHEVSSTSSLDKELEEEVGVRPIQPPREYIARVVRDHVRLPSFGCLALGDHLRPCTGLGDPPDVHLSRLAGAIPRDYRRCRSPGRAQVRNGSCRQCTSP